MAGSNNTTKIDSLVDPVADEQLLKLKASGKLLRDELNLLLETAVKLNATLGGSTPASFAKNLAASEAATAKIIANNNKIIDNEAKKAAKQEEIYNKYLVQLSRQEAARQQKEQRDSAADAKELQRLEKKTARAQQLSDRDIANRQKADAAKAAADAAQAQRDATRQQRDDAKAAKEAANAAKAAQAYNVLNAAYQEATQVARDAGARWGESSKQFENAAKSANFLRDRLDAIDKPLGNHQRNVGNYAGAIGGLQGSVNQLTRELPVLGQNFSTVGARIQMFALAISNNIPIFADQVKAFKLMRAEAIAAAEATGLQAKNAALAAGATEAMAITQGQLATQTAIANNQIARQTVLGAITSSLLSWQTALSVGITLLVLYGKDLGNWIAAIFKGTEALNLLGERQKYLNEALAGTEYSNAIKEVAQLTTEINLAKDGFISKEGALKHYNETIGKTTGQVKTLGDAEKSLTDNAENYVKMTLYKAAANLALQEAAKKAYEAEQIRLKNEQDFNTFGNRLKTFGVGTGIGANPMDGFKARQAANEAEKQSQIKIANDAKNAQLKIAEDFNKKAAQIAKDNKFDFFGDPEKEKKAPKDMTNTDLLEYNRLQLEEQQRITKMILDDDTLSYATRKAALEQYLIQSQKLLDNGEQIALSQADLRNQQKINIDQDYQNQSLKLKQDGQKQAEQLDNYELAKHKRHLSELLQISKESEQEQLESLNQGAIIAAQKLNDAKEDLINAKTIEFSKGKLTEQQYNRDLLAINDEYNVQRLAQEIAVQESILEIKKSRRDNMLSEAGLNGATPAELNKISSEANKGINSTENTISGLKTQYKSAVTKQTVDNAKDGKADSKDVKKSFEAAIANTLTLLSNTQSLTDDLYASQISQLEKVGQKIQENAQIERDGISRSLDTQANKARAMAVLDAQTASAQKNIQTQIAAEKTKQARADKAAAIAEIILNTAVASTKVTAQAGLLGLLTGVPAVITLGAIQLARVIATPIPQFAKGGTVNRTGLIVYGEQGKELVEEPGRTPYYSPGVATLAHVPAGTKITANNMLPVTPKWESNRSDNSDVVAGLSRIERAVSGQPKPKSGRINGWISEQRQADAYAAYSAKHFR